VCHGRLALFVSGHKPLSHTGHLLTVPCSWGRRTTTSSTIYTTCKIPKQFRGAQVARSAMHDLPRVGQTKSRDSKVERQASPPPKAGIPCSGHTWTCIFSTPVLANSSRDDGCTADCASDMTAVDMAKPDGKGASYPVGRSGPGDEVVASAFSVPRELPRATSRTQRDAS
jgi:hypothetical protein